MALRDAVLAVFLPDGPLSRAAEQFRPRQGQLQMAQAVADVIEQGGALVVEAGTGVGKTYAYLAPALLSGERVLLSTATKALQDQLFGRDLPRLLEVLGLPMRTALLKGRGSYLCLQRVEFARDSAALDGGAVRALAGVEKWARSTQTGDLAELAGLDERSPVIPLITSTRENCLGAQCPKFKDCFVNLARRDAMAADVVVINHHLFFADREVRESGMAELLPSARVVVFDEAHQLNETGVQFLGVQLGTGQLLDLARDLLATGMQLARGLADWQSCATGLERAARDLRLVAGKQWPGAKLRWSALAPEGIDPSAWGQSLAMLRQALEAAQKALEVADSGAPEFARLNERVAQCLVKVERFSEPGLSDTVRWMDVGSHLRLVESPLDIAQAMQTSILNQGAHTRPGVEEPGRSWVFTSATLGDDAQLRWFTEPCGLTDAAVLRVSSPFDYMQQSALYIPRPFPKPLEPLHSDRVMALAAQGAARLQGRTLVLTTTLRALRHIGEGLRLRAQTEDLPFEVLIQGELPKRMLMERFREGASAGRMGCVLVASATFWEGFDAPGQALELVVIDKLPFPAPNDPLVEARAQRLQAQGRSGFNDYFVPEAAVALKQGAGRLIRRESDRGILVVCDVRLATMAYGRRLVAALPPMRRLHDAEAFASALEELAEVN